MSSMYARFGIVLAVNTVVMFFVTYALLDRWGHFQPNINRVYMALMMVAPMGILMLAVMRPMYQDTRRNVALYVAFGALFIGSLLLARTQTPVGDDQFLRSMIPHHSSAILMCEEAAITDQQIIELCDEIVRAQEREIAEVEDVLARR